MKDRFACLFLTIFYLSFWFLIHYVVIGSTMLLYVAIIPSVYGFGHFFSCKYNDHIALAADSVAVPLTLCIALIVGGVELMMNTIDPKLEVLVNLFTAFGFSFVGAHIMLFASVYFYEKIKIKF